MAMKKGISLVLVMGIFVILGIIAFALITMSTTQMKISRFTTDSKIAFHAAEAGIDYGIARIPGNTDPFPTLPDTWITLQNQSKYKSGLPDTIPTPIENAGQIYLPGYSIELGVALVDLLYDITSSGKMRKSTKMIKGRVRCGPIPSGTAY